MPDRRSGWNRIAAWCACSGLLLASACVTLPQERTGATRPWKPPSTEKVMARYDEVSNKAAAARDLDLLAEVESGPLLAVNRAEMKIALRSDPNGSQAPAPVTHRSPQLFAPEFHNYPLWFVDRSTVESASGEERTMYGLTLRPDAGSTWRRVLEVAVDEGVEVPEVLTDDSGAAVELDPERDADLVRPADAIPRAYAGWIQGGLEALHAGAFEDSPRTVEILKRLQQERRTADRNGWKLNRSVVPTVHRSLATDGDGALVLFTLLETVQTDIGDGKPFRFQADSEIRAYTGEDSASQAVRATYVWQVGAWVPPQGKNGGLVRLIGLSRDLTTAEVE